MKKIFSVVFMLFILTACSSGTLQPVESIQTAIAIQQQQIELTQVALNLAPTQTALVALQSTQNAQISATQTREANPIINQNSDWTPVEQEFDGVTMVLVPVGRFMMGSDNGNSDEQPVHEQEITEPFWIDKYEVTQNTFEQMGGIKERDNNFDGDNRPVETIIWFEARDFCESRGGRLPTESEWEYAARGLDSLTYPWGNEWNENNAVWGGNSNSQTAEVGSLPSKSASWVGAYDMSGNVWEWVNTIYDQEEFPYPYAANDGRENNIDTDSDNTILRVLRGGSWGDGFTTFLRASDRYGDAPSVTGSIFGFRCARS